MEKLFYTALLVLLTVFKASAQKRHLLIDTDTASDDAVALIIAMEQPDVKIEAITTVAGNVPVDQGVQNALFTTELVGKKIPIYKGLSHPLIRKLQTAQYTHGKDGMGDIGLNLQGRIPEPGNAIDAIINTINTFPGEIEIVTLGPLTNIAAALTKNPSIANKVKSCTIMGGIGIGYGNVTPVSEYNIWVDPEAAQIVFQSGMPLKMVGWDISRKYAVINDKNIEELKAMDSDLADFSVNIQKRLIKVAKQDMGLSGFDLPDPIAMSIAVEPEIATEQKKLYVQIDLSDGPTRGQTLVDHLGVMDKKPNVKVVLEASRKKFLSLFYSSVQ